MEKNAKNGREKGSPGNLWRQYHHEKQQGSGT